MGKKFTTVQIYKKDLKLLESICQKGKNFRDKLHEIIEKEATKNASRIN